METSKALKFLESFSLLTVGDSKIPNFAWSKFQNEKISREQFIKQYEYKGGIFKKDGGAEIPATTNFGIICGFEHLEVLDVDLKVFSTVPEMKEFWDEFYNLLLDNIPDFEQKFVVYKTKNSGYHILYKTKRVEGNKKVAKLKGHKEAIFETRGTGGYVFAYPDNKVSKKSYFDIDYVTDADRETLFSICSMYDYVEQKIELPKKEKTEYIESEVTPWDDYNNKNSIFDVISGEFEIKHRLETQKKYVIKRHGATSEHSGYVFKDSGCMFLFSTGTIYPNEKLITPFHAYSYKYHSGNFSSASSALYKEGYGTRVVKKILEEGKKLEVPDYKINGDDLVFPIDIFPQPIQAYILECKDTLDSCVDYMGVSMLWLISVCIGNSIRIKVKNGWHENATIWISVVGKAGIGKTPSINNIIFPLQKINHREITEYYKQLEKFEYYNNLSKKEKQEHEEIEKPIKSQFIANDITLEALVDLHQESDNSVGVFKDELAGWFKDMNKYREGSDLEFWLSCWSGKSVYINRVTRKGSFVEKPLIPILGGIQPSILNSFNTEENKDNGFMDRMLLSYPSLNVEKYNDKELDYNTIEWYKNTIISFYEVIKHSVVKRNEHGGIDPLEAYLSNDAKKEWIRIFNEITEVQNSDDESEYFKSMLPKQKSYIPRFCLLIHTFDSFFREVGADSLKISKESILKAERLSKYFIATAKKIKVNNTEVSGYKTLIKSTKAITQKDKVKEIWEANKDFNRSEVAELLNVSRQTIMRYVKEFEV